MSVQASRLAAVFEWICNNRHYGFSLNQLLNIQVTYIPYTLPRLSACIGRPILPGLETILIYDWQKFIVGT